MNKIRVIKKGTRVIRKAVPKNEKRSKRAAARDMVANVSNWVVDFQERKRDEARLAIDQLFSNQPRTNES
jgi:hypothetical protein